MPLRVVRSYRALLVMLLVALAVRLMLLAASSSMPLQIEDEQHYAALATNLVRVHEFAFTPGELTSMRPPLYPAFIAGVWMLTGTEDPQAVRTVQVFISLFLILATYAVAVRLYSPRVAARAAAIVAFYPSLLYAGVLVLTEILFTALLLTFVLLYLALLTRPRGWVAVAMGAVLGSAALTRSVLWPFPVVPLPLLFLVLPGTARRRAAIAACCFAGFAGVVGPWAVRNTRVQRTMTMVDTMGGMNLRMGNYEHTPEDRMWDAVRLTGEKNWSYELGQAHPEVNTTWTTGQKDKWAQRAALNYMVNHPWTTLRRSTLKFADFWGLEREMIAAFQAGLYRPPRWFVLLSAASVLLVYPIVVLSAAFGVSRVAPDEWRGHWLLLALVCFVMAIHTVVFGHSRYHLPLVPFLAIYAAAAWTNGRWRQFLAVPGRATLVPIALMAILIAGWSHEVLFRDAERIHALVQAWL